MSSFSRFFDSRKKVDTGADPPEPAAKIEPIEVARGRKKTLIKQVGGCFSGLEIPDRRENIMSVIGLLREEVFAEPRFGSDKSAATAPASRSERRRKPNLQFGELVDRNFVFAWRPISTASSHTCASGMSVMSTVNVHGDAANVGARWPGGRSVKP